MEQAPGAQQRALLPSTRARRPGVVVALALVVAALTPAPLAAAVPARAGAAPGTGAAATTAAAATLVQLHQDTRAALGLPHLARDPALDAVAASWAAAMASSGTMAHRADLATVAFAAVPGASAAAENVGVGPDVRSVYERFLTSPSHLANITGAYDRIGVGVSVDGVGRTWVAVNFTRGSTAVDPGPPYWIASSDGRVWRGNGAPGFGDLSWLQLNLPVVGAASTPSGRGYWLVASDGGIFAFGDAGFFGSTGSIRLNQPIVGMASTPSGRGYWLVASDGGIFAFGDAGFFGSTGSIRLNQPIVGMASTPSGRGYWLVASDGGIFAFGDAAFHGSGVGAPGLAPVVGMAATPSGGGYWMVGAAGTVVAFGDAPAPVTQVPVSARRVSGLWSGAGVRVVDPEGRVVTFTAGMVTVSPPLGGRVDIVAVANAPG